MAECVKACTLTMDFLAQGGQRECCAAVCDPAGVADPRQGSRGLAECVGWITSLGPAIFSPWGLSLLAQYLWSSA